MEECMFIDSTGGLHIVMVVCLSGYIDVEIVLLLRMPIRFMFYVKYYVLNIFQSTIPMILLVIYASMTVYFIYCYYRLYLLTLSASCNTPTRYDIVYLIVNRRLVSIIGCYLMQWLYCTHTLTVTRYLQSEWCMEDWCYFSLYDLQW